jgi:autotransporter-associated beta strand protein
VWSLCLACGDDTTADSVVGAGGASTASASDGSGGGGAVGGAAGGDGGTGGTAPTGFTAVWSGEGADAQWTTAENWSGGVAPVPGDALSFPVGIEKLGSNNDYPAGTAFAGITLERGGYNLSGNAIVLMGDLLATNTTGANTVQLPLILDEMRTIGVAQGPEFDDLTLSGGISGSGALAKSGNGTVALLGHGSYQGNTTVAAGVIRVGGSGAIPDTTALTVASGAIFVLAGNVETIGSLAGGGTVLLGSGALTTGADDSSTTFSGNLSGSGSLTKTGSGTLTLGGSSPGFTGPTTVAEGTLLVGGNLSGSAITVSGGVLGGTGSVGAITVASSGSLAPGTSPGTLISTAGVSFAAGSELHIEINGTASGSGYDLLAATTAVNISGATLVASAGFTAAPGNTMTFLTCPGGITGTFAGLADLSLVDIDGQSFQIDYSSTIISLERQ